jgi:hypothetical protein
MISIIFGCHSNNNSQQNEERPEQVIPTYYKYFQGTVGNKKVIMQLIKYEDRYEGTFIDDSIGRPIPLAGEKDSSHQLLLISYDHYNPVDTFTGKFSQPGVFQGICSDTIGQHLPFILQEIYPAGTCRWDVYTLTDSLVFDSTKANSPQARVQFMLLWPNRKYLSKEQYTLLTDSIVNNYYGIDTLLTDPAKVLRSAKDTFFTPYKNFKESVKSTDYGGMTATFNWESDVNMQILWNAGNIVSMAYKSYQYTGGAHGLGNISLTVFDLNQNRILSINDIFKSGYEHVLQEVLENHLREQYDIAPGEPLNGQNGILFDKHLALTKNFYLTGRGIGFIYNPYEVAPYVVGQIELFVPFSEITGIVQPAFLGNNAQ